MYYGSLADLYCLCFLGHLGVSFYFIVSGTVAVQREEKDDRTREKHVQVHHICKRQFTFYIFSLATKYQFFMVQFRENIIQYNYSKKTQFDWPGL